jgi:hypothetical protein
LLQNFLILVTDCHSQQMGQLRVAEIDGNAQLIWGSCCPAFPYQFHWFGLATLFVVDASYWRTPALAKAHEEKLPVLGVTHYGKNPNPQPARSRSDGEGPPDLLSDQQQSWERTQSAL